MSTRPPAAPRRWAGRSLELLFTANLRLSELAMVAMMLLITTEIVCRSFFGLSLEVTDEVSGYLLVAITFLGATVSMRAGAMFRVEFLYAKLPCRGRLAMSVLLCLLALAFAVALEISLVQLVISSYQREVVSQTTLGTPQYLPQLVMPIGISLLIIELLRQVASRVRRLLGGNGAGEGEDEDRGSGR